MSFSCSITPREIAGRSNPLSRNREYVDRPPPLISSARLLSFLTKGLEWSLGEGHPRRGWIRAHGRGGEFRRRSQEVACHSGCCEQECAAAGTAAWRAPAAQIDAQAVVDGGRAGLLRTLHRPAARTGECTIGDSRKRQISNRRAEGDVPVALRTKLCPASHSGL